MQRAECSGRRRKENAELEDRLRVLARYGLGCAATKLEKSEISKYIESVTGKRPIDEGLLKKAIPLAYREVILNKRSCDEYFFGKHNKSVIRNGMGGTKFQNQDKPHITQAVKFCLVKKGTLSSIEPVTDKDRKAFSILFGDIFVKSVKTVGLVILDDGRRERVILDAVQNARVGSIITVHRRIACEVIRE